METLPATREPFWKAYIALVKPGIILGNAITAFSGFMLGSQGHYQEGRFLAMLFGLSLIIASGCAFNNYIDREADKKMRRTQNRPLAKGAIAVKQANLFAASLLVLGAFILGTYTHVLTMAIALFGFAIYVFFYSYLKYRTHRATLIGSIAGAIPPVVGYTAAMGRLDAAAWILFAILVFWQMPHFFAIAIYRLQDYAAASIPVLPLKKGIAATKIQMLIYTIAFAVACCLLPLCGYTNGIYLIICMLLGVTWIFLSFQGFKATNDAAWARKMFLFSLIPITLLSLLTPFCMSF